MSINTIKNMSRGMTRYLMTYILNIDNEKSYEISSQANKTRAAGIRNTTQKNYQNLLINLA